MHKFYLLRPYQASHYLVGCLTFLILIPMVSLGTTLRENAGDYSRVILSDRDRITLALKSLENAINDPSIYNMDIAATVLVSQDKSTLVNGIELIREQLEVTKQETKISADALFRIRPISLNFGEEFCHSEIEINLFWGNIRFGDTVAVDFEKSINTYVVKNAMNVISAVDSLMIGSVAKLNPDRISKSFLPHRKEKSSVLHVSPNLLKQVTLYDEGQIVRFNAAMSRWRFDNNIIFNRPFDIASFVYLCHEGENDQSSVAITDVNWDRVIVSYNYIYEGPGGGCDFTKGIGTYGNGDFEYYGPAGIDFYDKYWILADAYNHRAQVYFKDYHVTNYYSYLYTIQDNFSVVIDAAAGKVYSTDSALIGILFAVLDQGNGRVTIHDINGSKLLDMFSYGTEENQLRGPTSICFARNCNNQYELPFIYIADAGNKRIVRKRITWPYTWEATPPGLFPDKTHLTSVTVDPFGALYAVDGYNSKIYVLSANLEEISATYGSLGTADDELYWPVSLAFSRGWQLDSNNVKTPLIIGDAVLAEQFGEETGIRRYIPGFDVLDHELILWGDGQKANLTIRWNQSGTTYTSINLFCNDEPIYIGDTTITLPGQNGIFLDFWDDTSSSGYYKFEISLGSVFGTNDTTFYDSVYIDFPKIPDTVGTLNCDIEDGNDFEIDVWWRYPDDKDCDCEFLDIYRNNIFLATIPGDQQGFYDTTITSDGSYSYYLKARVGDYIISDPSLSSPPVSPRAFVPDIPTNFSATRTQNCTWRLTWDDNSNNEDVFHILIMDQNACGVPIYRHRLAPRNQEHEYYYNVTKYGQTINYYLWAIDSIKCHECNLDSSWGCYPGNFCFLCSDPYQTTSVVNTECESPGCPYLHVFGDSGYIVENNLLAAYRGPISSRKDFIDCQRITTPMRAIDGVYNFMITEKEDDVTLFDYISLSMVEHDSGLATVIDSLGNVYEILDEISPIKAVDHNGFDITAMINTRDNNEYYCWGPGYIDVTYPDLKAGLPADPIGIPPPKYWDPDNPIPKSGDSAVSGLKVNTLTIMSANGDQWDTVGNIHGRTYYKDDFYIPRDTLTKRNNSNLYRYQWNLGYSVDKLGTVVTRKLTSHPLLLRPVNMRKSRSGNILDSLSRPDGNRVCLLPRDTIYMGFAAPPPAKDGIKREFIFRADGIYYSHGAGGGTESTDSIPAKVSKAYFGNYPNPFNPATTFEFYLPERESVALEIFNILGQKVTTVVSTIYEAGVHSVIWEGNDSNGICVATGVYFARFRAGDFAQTRKVVVVK